MERFRAALAGQEVDRLPVSVWMHFGTEHLSGEEVAAIHLRYWREYDWDYLKVMNDYRYPLPGLEAVETANDLERFRPLQMDAYPFCEQLRCLRTLRQELGDAVPIVETIFDPLQTLVRAAGEQARQAVIAHPEAGLQALEAITETLCRYVKACAEAGVTGIFFSVNGARGADDGGVAQAVFQRFMEPFDRRVLQAAEGLVRIGHMHGLGLEFDRVRAYPVEAWSWSHHHTRPTLAEVRQVSRAAIIGGVDEVRIHGQTRAEVAQDIRATVEQARVRGLLIGPGCTVPSDTPRRLLHSVAEAARGVKGQEQPGSAGGVS